MGIKYLETSAVTGENIENIFYMAAREVLEKLEKGIYSVSELLRRNW